jgi:hypothetical protein
MHLKPKSVKDPGNTFNLAKRWARTLPFLIYFLWDIYRDPPNNLFSSIKIDISYLAVGLRCIIPPRYWSQLKTRAVFNWLKCLGVIMHLKPTAECQISTLIFEKKLWRGGLYKYHMKNIYITIDIWHHAVDLRCIIPPRHLSQLKTQAIPLN